MGASPPYEVFTGIVECVGALLLLAPRTTLLGALIQAGVLVNVVMLNFCYDVCVKLFSSTLLLMTLFLIVPDARRLLALFGLAPRAALPLPSPLPLPPRALRRRRLLIVAQLFFGLWLALDGVGEQLQFQADNSAKAPFPFAGRWAVERHVVAGRELPLSLDVAERWRLVTMIVSRGTPMGIAHRMDDTLERWRITLDVAKHELTLAPLDAPDTQTLSYRQLDADHLQLDDDHRHVSLTLRRLPARAYLLTTRGFHLISSDAYER
jgi:hypothetical protein